MNAADAFDAAELQHLRSHIAIVHHIPGRIRVRLGAGLRHSPIGIDRARLQGLLTAVDGIREVRVNPGVGSVVIHYDCHRIAPEDFETLVRGEDAQAHALLDRLLSGCSRTVRNSRN